MVTIPPVVLLANDPQFVAAPISHVLQGMLLGVLVALLAAGIVLRRAVAGTVHFARSVLGPPLTVFTVLALLALVLVAGHAGAAGT